MKKNSKTIIYIGSFQMPDKNAAAHRVLNNAKILKMNDYNVVFIDIDITGNHDILKTKKIYFGFEIFSVANVKKRFIGIEDFKKIYNLYEENIVGVIAYNYPSLALMKLKKFCTKNKLFLIGDVTEWYVASGNNFLYKLIKKIDISLRMRVIQPNLDGNIVISRYLENYYKNSTLVIRIPPLTDLKELKWGNKSCKKTDKLRILYAGTPGYNKDKLNKIIQGVKKSNYSDIVFFIAGITKDEFLTYYPEEKQTLLQLSKSVFFLGKIEHKIIIDILKKSDYTLFFREDTRLTKAGFPTKFVESISCGIPVITNNNSDLAEYIKNNKNGFILSTSKFENALSKLLNDLTTKTLKKPVVERNIFHYENYKDDLLGFINKIFNKYN